MKKIIFILKTTNDDFLELSDGNEIVGQYASKRSALKARKDMIEEIKSAGADAKASEFKIVKEILR